MKLNIIGTPYGTSGYALHTANIVKALKANGIDVGIECWQMPANWKEFDFKEEVQKNYTKEPTLMITTPDLWTIKSGDRVHPLIGYCVFEGDKIPYNWAVNIANGINTGWLDGILVPSSHTLQSVLNGMASYGLLLDSSFMDKIKIIPHGFDPNVFKPDGKKIDQYMNENYKFLFVGGWRDGKQDRKGLDILVEAFCEEFKPDEKVELVAKINMAYQTSEQVVAAINSLNIPGPDKRPPINVDMSQNAPTEFMAALYRTCNCLVMPSKAEAFCMPCLEALACGLVVITTNYGGQTDYVPKAGLIDVEEMVPATAEPLLYENTMWARPSKDHLKRLMRQAFEGRMSAVTLPDNYTWDSIAKEIIHLYMGNE